LKTSEIHIRDPFVFPLAAEQRYYLYGTRGPETWTDSATGLDCYTSADLQNWDGPFPAFRPPAHFWSDRNFWAPEVYAYHGRYVMLASFKADGVRRGTQTLAADRPLGPFVPLSERPVTPRDWECLDGTLFVDASDQPWIVFCHEWVQVGDGEICALRLNDDLTAAVGEPHLLFQASEAPWPLEINSKGRIGTVTDGPFVHRLASGALILLWSSISRGGYAVGMARSASGELLGPWEHEAEPLYAGDGGHCMAFRTFGGPLRLALHHPNASPQERPLFLPLRETESSLAMG